MRVRLSKVYPQKLARNSRKKGSRYNSTIREVRRSKSASDEDKKNVKEKTEDILKRIKAGEDFAKLASDLSDDPGSKSKGGDLGFFLRGQDGKIL